MNCINVILLCITCFKVVYAERAGFYFTLFHYPPDNPGIYYPAFTFPSRTNLRVIYTYLNLKLGDFASKTLCITAVPSPMTHRKCVMNIRYEFKSDNRKIRETITCLRDGIVGHVVATFNMTECSVEIYRSDGICQS